MSDEIDIEEHDVMDNPSIKRIFPDLSVIKKEISQYYDEAFVATTEATFEKVSQDEAITNPTDPEPHIESENELVVSDSSSESEVEVTKKKLQNVYENIIILGSKPNLECPKKYLEKKPKLVLKNVSNFLNKCKRYCKECLILFPHTNVFNCHLRLAHTQNNNISIDLENGRKLADKPYECNICNKRFSNKQNLIRHFKNLHGNVKSIKMVNISNTKISSSGTSTTIQTTNLACFHCQQLFPNNNSLIEHLYEVLDPSKVDNGIATTISKIDREKNKVDNSKDKVIEREFSKGRVLHEDKIIDSSQCALKFNSLENNYQHFKDNNLNSISSVVDANKENSHDISPQNIPESIDGVTECHDNETIRKVDKVNHKVRSCATKRAHKGNSIMTKPNKCKECIGQFRTKKELQYHVLSAHRKNPIPKKKLKSKIIKESIDKSGNGQKKRRLPMFYKCFICSKYNASFQFYSQHLITDHKIKEVTKVRKKPFKSQCKFCFSNMSDIKSYNVHLAKYHKELLKIEYFPPEKQQEKNYREINIALKNILYKCLKCELFSLTCNAAIDHSQHIIETRRSTNWRCTICKRLFRKEDKALHLKQHSCTQTFTIHSITDSAFSRVLYKCTNCTVHYSEDKFLLHYPSCDLETPDSLYCKFCDILINTDDMEFHSINHNDKKFQCTDFIVIESDVINIKDLKSNQDAAIKSVIRNESSQESSILAMTFCDTCKCFVNMNMTRIIHFEARCGHMDKTVCKDCGLVMTNKIHATHKELHKKRQINLNDYLFFDFKSKKRICPPIPEFPKCNMCGVHFLRNSAIRVHECQDQNFITCKICSIKLTEHAYKLHMPFHTYSLQNSKRKLNNTQHDTRAGNDNSYNENSQDTNDIDIEHVSIIYFTCKSCQVTVDTYDKVVQHCQDHYDCKEIQINKRKCHHCIFVFLTSDLESHNLLHLNGKYNKDLIKVVDYDPFYFRFNNEFWTKHIFSYVSNEQIAKIRSSSKYKYECRLKMVQIQSGSSSLMLYKCDKCQVIIDPDCLFMHAMHSRYRSCIHPRKYSCTLCGLNFVSLASRKSHEKEHDIVGINIKSYTIILFNKIEHDTFNKIICDSSNRFILYQCRNCEAVVDKFERKDHMCDVNNLKICTTCGLLFHKKDYDLHFIRHEELDKFNIENLIVVMFGKPCYVDKKELKSTFGGTKFNYTLYKCSKCNLCLRSKKCITEHVCVLDNSKCKCAKCGLYFSKLELTKHFKLHESNLEFDLYNVNLISFDPSTTNFIDYKITSVDNNDEQQTKIPAMNKSADIENKDVISEKLEKIYKCECGLHFLEEPNAQQHANNCNVRVKISKQRCFKCDLLFTPGELFNHLLKHHDKKLQLKFDIIDVCKQQKK